MFITDEQRQAIDDQVRERVLCETYPINRKTFLPESAIILARVRLGFGVNLENACPYMHDCGNKTSVLCTNNSYRNCAHYKLRLTTDFLDGQIDLAQAGLEQSASLPAK